MAHVTADRVRDTSTSTSTGNFVVSGTAPTGFRTLSSVLTAGDTFYYAIQLQGYNEWEVGLGTYSSANTFARTTILSSSNSGSAVNFSAGQKDVFLTLAASKTIQNDASGSVGTIQFAAGTVSAPGITTVGDTNTGIFFPAADTIALTEGGVEAMRLDSQGNVAIGTTTAIARLHVYTDSPNWNFRFDGNNFAGGAFYGTSVNTSGVSFGLDGSGGFITNVRDAGYLAYKTNDTERLRIASAGQIGIGGTNYGTSGQVLTSGGASAAPSWATPTIDLTGTIISYGSSSAPSGYLACDGSTYLKSSYSDLSTVIGQAPTLQASYNSNLVQSSPVHYVNGNLISGTKFSSNGGGSWSNIGTNNISSSNAPSGNWIWTGTYYVNGGGYAGSTGIRHRTTLAGAGTAVTTGINYAVYGLAWNGSNLAIAGGIALATISYSANGIAWTTGATLGTGGNCNDVAFGNGVFVIAGRNTANGPSIWTTTNGTAVTLQTLPSGFTSGATRIYTVTYANSLFIAVNDLGAVASSPDGVTWTLRAAAYTLAPQYIALNASATSVTEGGPYLYSGIPLGEFTHPISRTMYCNGLYFNGYYYSSDLITWRLIPPFQIGNSPNSIVEASGWCGTDGTTMFYSGYTTRVATCGVPALITIPSSFNPFNYTTSTQFVVPNMTGLQAPNQYYYIKT
jgi:hypothetical protein